MTDPRFVIISPGRNTAPFVADWVSGLQAQTYPHWRAVWIDDASTDKSYQTACAAVGREDRIELRTNDHRQEGLANLYWAVQEAEDDEIIVLLGADDYLMPHALERIAQEYRREVPHGTWMTYGNYQSTDGSPSRCGPIRHEDFRNHPFVYLHPLTFRARLFRKVRLQDLQVQGRWQPSSGDVAFTIPMVEMAGSHRVRFIDEVLATYRVHPHNDAAEDKRVQDFYYWLSKTRPRYSQLASLDHAPTIDDDRQSPCTMGLLFVPHTDKVPRAALAVTCDIDAQGQVRIGPR